MSADLGFAPACSFVVECFVPGVRVADVTSAARRAVAASEELRTGGASVTYGGAILVPDDEVVLHLFHSDSARTVRAASERAALGFERIVETFHAAGDGRAAELIEQARGTG